MFYLLASCISVSRTSPSSTELKYTHNCTVDGHDPMSSVTKLAYGLYISYNHNHYYPLQFV